MKIRADGCCMVEAVLPQFLHHKEKYNSKFMQRQVGLHLLKHANLFYPFVQHDLEAMNESYESYCVNVFTGQVWGDDLILSAIGHMFNIAITIITPCFDKPVALFHEKDIPDVVVIANRGDYLISSKPSTHFSGSKVKAGVGFKMPGHEMVNTKLDQVLNKGFNKGKENLLRHYLAKEKSLLLAKLHGVVKGIEKFDTKIVELIKESDKLMKRKEAIEHKLGCLGMDVKKFEKAGKVKERGYVRTEEQKKMDEALEAAEELEKRKEAEATATGESADLIGAGLSADTAITLDLDDYSQPTLTSNQYQETDLEQKMNLDEEICIDEELINQPIVNQPIVNQSLLNQPIINPSDEGGNVQPQGCVTAMALRLGMDPNLLRFLPEEKTMTKDPELAQKSYTVVEVIQDEALGTIQQIQKPASVQPIVIQSGSMQQLLVIDSGLVQQQQILTTPSQGLSQQSQSQFQQSQSQFQELPREYITAPRSRTTIGSIPESERDYSKYVYCNRCPHKYKS